MTSNCRALQQRVGHTQEEASGARAARMEVETALQALEELLDSDLRRRLRELQETLSALDVDADQCALLAGSPCDATTPHRCSHAKWVGFCVAYDKALKSYVPVCTAVWMCYQPAVRSVYP